MSRLLITGGAGFIGVNAARHFLRAGWEVTVLDNFSRKGTEQNLEALKTETPAVNVVRADIRTDNAALLEAVSAHDAVLHLAAQVAVTTSITDPRNDFEQNVLGTFNVLEAVRQSKNQPPLIYASTNKVYGALEDKPVTEKETRFEFQDPAYQAQGVPESYPLDFHSPYGCSKGAADQYVLDYARIYGLKTLVFRQSCIYGEHQFGVEDQGWIAWFTIAAMFNRPLTIYGNGKQVRDALFVTDLCRLYELGFANMERVKGQAYNVGGGPKNTLSLMELLAELKTRFNYAPALSHADVRAGDQPIFVADLQKAQKDFNWEPQMGVGEGLESMHAWLVANKETIARVLGV